ncbi:DUF4276 domain-containing protein [Sulfidibacter corallicola]|uniref:DUF4276 family protein n=1 Tax=Sulfidibacter corallicola TaxID=2818388 RepID=A0A8A4TMB0_SULCO|nr:DUF4276 family protein [Sulfidibacter corallicola]QTD50607.1 DUF4276 family protein [Sulfidibacter corallicola]
MNPVEVYLLVEGQTERTFARESLAPALASQGVYLHPTLVGTPGHKGGDVRFERARKDIARLLKQRNDTFVTTMLDFFRIDPKWPGRERISDLAKAGTKLDPGRKAEIIEAETRAVLEDSLPRYGVGRRFIPYFAMHEFEALLFSDPAILSEITEIDERKIRKALSQFETPEHINEAKGPSKYLMAWLPGYKKVAMGNRIAAAIGMATMRDRCPHFHAWLLRLASLPRSPQG